MTLSQVFQPVVGLTMALVALTSFSFGQSTFASVRLQLGAQAANLFNHANCATPNMTFNTAAFGTISNVQSAEGAGPRAIQATARLTF